MLRIPVDSTDAHELRELEAEQDAADALERRQHAERCRGGWLGLDDEERPVPCIRCRPHLLVAPCRVCGATYETCNAQQAARRGACCDQHDHARRGHPATTNDGRTTP